MLRLEKLEIVGFKSFPDRTSLVFGEGTTAVVGPNGCGKSNIAEAISWVLGEQSAKNLRGGKMEDVIFNGTRDRKPVGMAEVILTLVASTDITAGSPESEITDEESKYDAAISSAERASESALQLIEEASPKPEEVEAKADAAAATREQVETAVESQAAVSEAGEAAAPASKPAAHHHRPRKKKTIAISAGERITIGRRLYRTGDSDYLMNGRLCLLRDVQDLFAGTGLGGAHYAIIEQGRIGQILSSKPLDRRALIEEAAGITKFKSRKRAAELKLESAKQNLIRLNDIISEVERQVNSLRRQAGKARRYRRLREEMRSLLKLVFAADYHRLNDAAERLARELEAASEEQRELEVQLLNREEEHRAASTGARTIEDRLTELRERAAALELELDRVRNRRAFDDQQLKQLASRIEDLERESRGLNERLDVLDSERERRSAELKALEEEVRTLQSDLITRETEYQEEVGRLRRAEEAIEALRHKLLGEISNTERIRNLSASVAEATSRVETKQTGLRLELERATARRVQVAAQHSSVREQVEAGRLRVAELTESLSDRSTVLGRMREEIAVLRSELEQSQTERAAAEHRLASLEDLDVHRAYYSDAVQQVLSPEHAARINAKGTLADYVEVEPQYEGLVESLFSRELQCILVPTIDDALAGADYLKAEGLGRGAFLVVGLHGAQEDPTEFGSDGDSPLEPEENDALDQTEIEDNFYERLPGSGLRFHLEELRALDLMGLRPEIRSVVERAFPDKCAASVVPDIEAALHRSIENGWRIYVTLDGQQVVNGRLIVTGAQAGQQGTSLLGLKREIRQLRAQTETLRAAEEVAQNRVQVAQEALEAVEREAAALDRDLRADEKAVAAGESQLEGLQRDLERAEQHVRVVESEIEQAGHEHADLAARLEQLTIELASAEASRDAVQSSLSSAQATLLEQRAAAEALAEQLSAARATVAARTERLSAVRSEARRIENEAEELNSRAGRNRLELYESHTRVEEINAANAENEAAAARFDQELGGANEEIREAAESLTSARALLDQLNETLAGLRQDAGAARDRRAHLEVEQARVQSDAEHLVKACYSELAMTLEDVVTSVELSQAVENIPEPDQDEQAETPSEAPPVFGVESSRTRLDELRVKIDEMGPVNMMALEELEEASERSKFLTAQRSDILESIKGTEEALAEIKRRSRERFRTAFDQINENFQKMFVELFGGGRGEMVLIDEEDVLESGIDLIAQPPGKRLQNVLLLSGGEKAMVAVALVLAIFQFRPSPFCVLDEVDAPLDEVNVVRFADHISEMSRNTQFLVITHNKRTMESARALYGVTMEEPGVSKLVSVRFE